MKVLDSQIRGVEKAYKPEVQVYAEFLTDLLACLANESATLDKQFKGEVTQLFYQDSFFLMSERTLRKWQIIMRHYLNRNPERCEELWNLVGCVKPGTLLPPTRSRSFSSARRGTKFSTVALLNSVYGTWRCEDLWNLVGYIKPSRLICSVKDGIE